MQKLIINTEFKQLIPPLSQDEYTQLEQNIVDEVCREPIIIWNNTMIDGHNRYEICTKHNILFATVDKDFEDYTDAKIWIIRNQFGRRNLQTVDRVLLVSKFKPLIQKRAMENKIKGGRLGTKITNCKLSDASDNEQVLQDFIKPVESAEELNQSDFMPIETARMLAKMADTTHETVERLKELNKQHQR